MWLPDLQIRENEFLNVCESKAKPAQRFLGTNFPRVYTNKYTKLLLY